MKYYMVYYKYKDCIAILSETELANKLKDCVYDMLYIKEIGEENYKTLREKLNETCT